MSPTHLIEVSFKGNRREFFQWPFPDVPALRTAVIVDADRGEDLGLVHATGELAAKRKAGTTHGKEATEPLRGVLRAANGEEIQRGRQLREDEQHVRRSAIEKVRTMGLEMKVSDIEWQWDRKKLTMYFTAEKRVDFRQLVRQLELMFSTRVQMWHIGVRDEARRLDGVGRCGRQFCSASWLPDLRPVKSSTAKDQRLSTLNPAQISGSCGRLMCCLRYEHEFYVQQRKRFPKEGKILVTRLGEEKVVSNDIFWEQVTLRSATGDARIIPLATLQEELGQIALSATAEHLAEPDDGDEGEEEELLVTLERAAPAVVASTAPPVPAPAPKAAPAPPAQQSPPVAPAPPLTEEEKASRDARRRRRGRRGRRRGHDGGSPSPAGGDAPS